LQPLALFSLATQEANWLSAREATIASNVANANTPGYQAQDVQPFSAVLSHLQLTMAADQPGQMQPAMASGERISLEPSDSWETVYSGNSVDLDQEMMKAGDVSRAHALNVSIVRAFQQMLLNAVKG
jgi:flagellar basal-body rod protein FlgB